MVDFKKDRVIHGIKIRNYTVPKPNAYCKYSITAHDATNNTSYPPAVFMSDGERDAVFQYKMMLKLMMNVTEDKFDSLNFYMDIVQIEE